jgi:hypothetical protein
MKQRRPPARRVSKSPARVDPDPSILIERLYADLVELESVAMTADMYVMELPVILIPTGKRQRTMKAPLHARRRHGSLGWRRTGARRGHARRGRDDPRRQARSAVSLAACSAGATRT